MRLGLAAFALATLIGASAASGECLQANQDEQMAEGILSLGSFEDANDRPEKAYILTLSTPACLSGGDEMDKSRAPTQSTSILPTKPSRKASSSWSARASR